MSKFAKPTINTVTAAKRRTAKQLKRASAPVKLAQIRQPAAVTSDVEVVRKASETANTRNKAGGKAFTMSDKMEFVTAAFTGLLSTGRKGLRTYYEPEPQRIARIISLIPKVGAEFAAKTALSLRIQHGQRSMSHLITAALAPLASGEPWASKFYEQVVRRADDMCETVAAIWKYNGEKRKVQDCPGKTKMKLPSALKRGFAAAFEKLDAYRLAKYGSKPLDPSLRSLALMVHPAPTPQNAEAMKALLDRKLVNTDTWEAQLSAAGQTGKSKSEVWTSMVREGKLLQLALLKNLRNISENCSDETVRIAVDQLTDEDAIRKNGILPAQYLTAYNNVEGLKHSALLKAGIDTAVEIAAGNIPSIGNNVLIAIDESGSMLELERNNAAIFAASLLKSNPKVDLMCFANSARYVKVDRTLPLLELMKEIRANLRHGGTNFHSIFQAADKAYDTIVILSDNEGWMVGKSDTGQPLPGVPTESLKAYQLKYNIVPTVFSFDLGGDGSLMFREDSVITLAGCSFHVFKLLNILKTDRTKLVDQIDKIEIGKRLPSLEEDED